MGPTSGEWTSGRPDQRRTDEQFDTGTNRRQRQSVRKIMSVRTKHERKVDSTHEANRIAVIPDAKPPRSHADFLPVLEKPERADFPSGAGNEASFRRFRSKRASVLSSRSGSPLLARNSSANPMSSGTSSAAENIRT